MNDEIAKLALSYDLASYLHEIWRSTLKKKDGTYEPRMKKSTDEKWNITHETDDVDIANCSFKELPSNWQKENFEAAKVAINLVYDKINCGRGISLDDLEEMAATIHEEWLKRNPWVFNNIGGNSKLAVPYNQLSKAEQDKDKAQILPAVNLVKAYINGLINIEELCQQYNIVIDKEKTKKL